MCGADAVRGVFEDDRLVLPHPQLVQRFQEQVRVRLGPANPDIVRADHPVEIVENAEAAGMSIYPGVRRARGNRQLQTETFCPVEVVLHARHQGLFRHKGMAEVSLPLLQIFQIQRITQETLQMGCCIEARGSGAADDLRPRVQGKRKPVFRVDTLPGMDIGRLGIQDKPIEIEDQSLYSHSGEIIPEPFTGRCYTPPTTSVRVAEKQSYATYREMRMEDLYYSDYIELDKILDSQHPKSFSSPEEGNDEMLFIIVHQVYELWFKQILFELDLVRHIFTQGHINDNSDDLSRVVYKLKRIGKILELINQQVTVLETMTSLDFLEFRNRLLPASGFQSKQFRLIEAKLGLKMDQRYKREYYKYTRRGSLSEADLRQVDQAESESTLKELIIEWLERMPFFEEEYWRDYRQAADSDSAGMHKFWVDYRNAYQHSLSGNESERLAEFDRVFFEEGRGSVSPAAMRAALFITIYRNLPIFHMPFELLNTLSEIDELLSNWRYRHFLMVRRMIGLRVGTGGTSGAGYLEGTLSQHYAFREITEVATFLIERSKRPELPNTLKEKVSFQV